MLSRIALSISFASIFLGGESIRLNTPSELPIIQHNGHGNYPKQRAGLVHTMDAAPPRRGEQIPQDDRDTWIVTCDSELTSHGCEDAVDGSNTTFWHTKYDTQSVKSLPHTIVIDLREIRNVNAISTRPLPDADLGGAVAGHNVFVSLDEVKWDLVAFGTWFEDVQGELLISL